jgi:hypothetical protein
MNKFIAQHLNPQLFYNLKALGNREQRGRFVRYEKSIITVSFRLLKTEVDAMVGPLFSLIRSSTESVSQLALFTLTTEQCWI